MTAVWCMFNGLSGLWDGGVKIVWCVFDGSCDECVMDVWLIFCWFCDGCVVDLWWMWDDCVVNVWWDTGCKILAASCQLMDEWKQEMEWGVALFPNKHQIHNASDGCKLWAMWDSVHAWIELWWNDQKCSCVKQQQLEKQYLRLSQFMIQVAVFALIVTFVPF